MAGTKHLEGKVAIVTGGAGGMGSWVSKTYAEQGAKVVVADTGADVEGRMGVDPTRVDAVVKEITDAGGEAISFIGDISDMDVAEDLIRKTLDAYNTVDIFVAAHGILRERMVFNMTEDDWDGVIQAHLKGCFAVTKYASIIWRQQRESNGRIIYFTSDAGISGGPGQSNYSAAQAGKIGLMRSNARALSRYGVTSNCIAPLASTRMTDRGRGASGEESASAEGTPMDPRNVAPLLVWLASDEGGVANGRIFGVSGHRISLYEEPVRERFLYSEQPLWDIDRVFELWPKTIGLQDYPMPEIQGIQRRPAE
ncbi:MAG: SDR family NAD(P)-dependent oxidoreductase [Dehalococcoidia bacterium]|nr:SDR family NAD(P)-dependent oxidoreductase [Dehalococcoidia bacterium]